MIKVLYIWEFVEVEMILDFELLDMRCWRFIVFCFFIIWVKFDCKFGGFSYGIGVLILLCIWLEIVCFCFLVWWFKFNWLFRDESESLGLFVWFMLMVCKYNLF